MRLAERRDVSAPLVLLAAGGTGGHLFPAEALATELARRGAAVELVTDARAAAYAGSFPARARHVVAADTVRGRDPVDARPLRPHHGAGPSCRLAADGQGAAGRGGGLRRLSHRAAAVRGELARHPHRHPRAERRARPRQPLAGAARQPHRHRLSRACSPASPALAAKAAFTGNPTRPAVIAAAATRYDAAGRGGPLRLLVFGGSQGARVMSEIVPAAISRLPPELRGRLAHRAAGAARGPRRRRHRLPHARR